MPDNPQQRAEHRLALWRRSIALFDENTAEEGPFHEAGYREYTLEPKLDNETTPDILGVSPERFVICELSFSPHKNTADLRKYTEAGLTPYLRGRHGGDQERTPGAAPFYLTPTRALRDFPREINALNVHPPFEKHLPSIDDGQLASSLEAWIGFTRPPPSYGLLGLPESDPQELRRPLGGLLKQRASAGDPITAPEATQVLLGDLADAFQPGAKREMRNNLKTLLKQAAEHLDEYGRWNETREQLSFPKPIQTTSARKAFDKRLSAWLGITFIEQWYEEEPVTEDDERELEE